MRNRDSKEMNITSQKHNYANCDIEILKTNVPDMESMVNFFLKFRYIPLIMIESAAYFESYIHVLNKIKKMDKWENGLPLGKYYALVE